MIADLVAALAKRPYSMAPEAVGRLTLRQVQLLAARAKATEPPAPAMPSEKELFWYWGKQNKLRDGQIQRLWDERKAVKE